mmetsp:Transcript_27046/g.76076  ORF Transcript_27046/g.76076 Transcript_27046/m.76076 type:complete len:280 (-) Transcript_27046:61-900(-)
MTCTRFSFKKSIKSSCPGSCSTVKLHRSMMSMSGRTARAVRTRKRKFAFSSGAPPVISSVVMDGVDLSSSMHCAAVSAVIISVLRRGDDSTWQWLQAWLQYRPMLSCRMVVGLRCNGCTFFLLCPSLLLPPTSFCLSARYLEKDGMPRSVNARRRCVRSSFEMPSKPIASILFVVSWNSSSVSSSASVSAIKEDPNRSDRRQSRSCVSDVSSEGVAVDVRQVALLPTPFSAGENASVLPMAKKATWAIAQLDILISLGSALKHSTNHQLNPFVLYRQLR